MEDNNEKLMREDTLNDCEIEQKDTAGDKISETSENENFETSAEATCTELEVSKSGTEAAVYKESNIEVGASDNKINKSETEPEAKKGIVGWFINPDTRKKAFILSAAVAVGLIMIIVILCTVFGNEEPEMSDNTPAFSAEEVSSTPTPTVTPAPTSTPAPTVTPAPTATPEPEPTPELEPVIHENEEQSALTGEWISKEISVKRPYCIMFNNIEFANPQSGIGCADILYEALTEGGITRMMGVFEGLTEEDSCAGRIGSVRSARHYFAEFADMYDAIFIHYGETTYATKMIDKLNLDHLEGTYGIGSTVYYRDKSIKAPHNAFASLEGIHKGIEKMKFRTDHEADWTNNHFEFVDTDLLNEAIIDDETLQCVITNEAYSGSGHKYSSIEGRDSEQAYLIKFNYSNYMQPYLTYNEETGLYTRYQYNGVHIDYNTNSPLTFKNVIIQIVKEWNKDKNGYQDMELADTTGRGYYITEGRYIPITWTRNEKDRFMMYYTEDGETLVLNNGKTFISVYPDFREDKLIIE